MLIDLTEDEVSLAGYALREMVSRRLEQAIDAKCHAASAMVEGCKDDARRCHDLAQRFADLRRENLKSG